MNRMKSPTRPYVLIIGCNETRLSLRRFVLQTAGFRVLTAEDPELALEQLARGVTVVIGDGRSRLPWQDLTREVRRRDLEVSIVLTDYPLQTAPYVDQVLNEYTAATLVDTLRVLARRRRNAPIPRKPPASETPAIAEVQHA
jgi:CheY-like chemotaxis protein